MLTLLLVYTLYLVSAQVGCDYVRVKGYEGGSVIINYKYSSQQYSNHTKYVCKTKEGGCENVLNPTERKWDPNGKLFAVDETLAGVYSLFIRNLSQEDEGRYRCGVENQTGSHLNMELDVENGVYHGRSVSQTTHPGDNVTFVCTYPEEHEADIKSVYKVSSRRICAIIFTYGTYEQKERYVLYVSPGDQVVVMSISNVTVDDGGLYLCGVSNIESPYVSIFSEMQLQVTAAANIPSPDSSVIVITVYVGVALLLIAGFALIFYKLWFRKARDASSPADGGNLANREDAHPSCYEEFRDPQLTTVYAMAQKTQILPIPQNPAGAPITSTNAFYSMILLSKTEA